MFKLTSVSVKDISCTCYKEYYNLIVYNARVSSCNAYTMLG